MIDSKAQYRLVVALVTLCATAIFFSTGARTLFVAPDTEIPIPEALLPPSDIPPEEYPERIVVPAIGVDALVRDVGINEKGNMATPGNYTDVGWYRYGSLPGERGSAVFAGHVDNGLGLDGVFKRLDELEVGDEIFIQDREGKRLRFVVTSARAYQYKDTPADILFNRVGASRVNLITCAGTWVRDEKTYDQRLVVSARLLD